MATPIPYRNRATMPTLLRDPLDDISQSVANISANVGLANDGTVSNSPPDINSIAVTGGSGIFQVVINDNNPITRSIKYWFEYDTSPNFPQPHAQCMDASRTWRGNLGNLNLYFRGFSQYSSRSQAGTKVTYGTPPILVSGASSISEPVLPPSTGSGTAPSDGRTGGVGAGNTPTRGNPKQI